MNLSIIGAGAWGTALATHWVKQGHTVTLLPHTLEAALELAASRENQRYLPGVELPLSLQIGYEILPVLLETEALVLACPSGAVRTVCQSIQPGLAEARQLRWIVAACKGLEPKTHLRPSEVISQELPGLLPATLSGPSFADEVARGQPTAVVLASEAEEVALAGLQEELSGGTLRLYRSHDLTGVELCGALKNPYAIVAGICDGLGLGFNAKSALLTRSLQEMVRVGSALGGKPETFYGLSGLGDLVATFHGTGSRNRTLGEKLGKGIPAAEALSSLAGIAEGYESARICLELARLHQIDSPILECLHQVLFEKLPVSDALGLLLSRDLKPE